MSAGPHQNKIIGYCSQSLFFDSASLMSNIIDEVINCMQ